MVPLQKGAFEAFEEVDLHQNLVFHPERLYLLDLCLMYNPWHQSQKNYSPV